MKTVLIIQHSDSPFVLSSVLVSNDVEQTLPFTRGGWFDVYQIIQAFCTFIISGNFQDNKLCRIINFVISVQTIPLLFSIIRFGGVQRSIDSGIVFRPSCPVL